MKVELWHLVILVACWIIGQPFHRWLRLKEKEQEQAHTLRRNIAESPDPVQAVSALTRLEAFEQSMQQTQQLQEESKDKEELSETIEIEGQVFRPVLSFSDFQS